MESTDKRVKTAVLIPCYNEGQTIGQVIKDFQASLPEAEIYVYDNNSTDSTYEIAKAAGAIVCRERKQGKGNVMRRMFREIDADCYIIVDGDCTYPADIAPVMAEKVLNDGIDMVIGDRLSSTYFSENKRPFHNFGNKIVRYLIRKFWRTDIHDVMTGYRAFSRRFVKLFPIMTGQFEIETEMTVHALDKRYDIFEMPIDYKDRPTGSVSKLSTFSDGFKVLKTIMILFKEYRPMLFFGWLFVILALLSIAFFTPVLVDYLKTGCVPRFPTLFVSLFLLLAALQSLFTGLCLDVMVQKDRKEYELKVINYK